MTDNTDNLVIKILQDLQARMARLEAGQNRLEMRMTALEQHFAAALMLTASDRAEIDQLRQRVEHIERRLELHDETTS